ncbi:hypothetical protein DFP73DRAFT_379372 [Morchella snyderi]|nr:hypothetical protein DFP73DRAFT_379372 [Morchella snyderi]
MTTSGICSFFELLLLHALLLLLQSIPYPIPLTFLAICRYHKYVHYDRFSCINIYPHSRVLPSQSPGDSIGPSSKSNSAVSMYLFHTHPSLYSSLSEMTEACLRLYVILFMTDNFSPRDVSDPN